MTEHEIYLEHLTKASQCAAMLADDLKAARKSTQDPEAMVNLRYWIGTAEAMRVFLEEMVKV